MVGAGMVAREPDLFSAYVSVGTVGSHEEAERARYRLLGERLAPDSLAAERLKEIGLPPYHAYEDVMAFGDLFSEQMGVEGSGWKAVSIEAVQAAVGKNEEYTEEELEHTVEAMDVLFRLTAKSTSSFDARTAFPRIEVPTYFAQGSYDANCPREPALDYFNKLVAPRGKHWVEFEGSAHFPMYEESERFAQVLRAARSGTPPPPLATQTNELHSLPTPSGNAVINGGNDLEGRGFTDAYLADDIPVQCLTTDQTAGPSSSWAAVASSWSRTTWPSIIGSLP
jgi:pimeloyl-ACP methyl ester carboxylesterase